MLTELHLGAVEMGDNQAKLLISSVHGHATGSLADMRKRKDACNGVRIEPDFAKVEKITNELGLLETSIGDGA